MRRSASRSLAVVLAVVVAVLLSACGSGETAPGGVVSWRELTIDLPDGWIVLDTTEHSLVVADGPGSTTPGERGDQEVATQFQVDPATTADDWRAFVEDEEGEMEVDREAMVGSLSGRLLQWRYTTNGIPMRERVVVVPSRDLVILQQPTPMQGETGGPDWFDRHLPEFDQLLEDIRFGAPEGYLEDD